MRVLFLTTDLFNRGSGIARMARLVCKALNDSSEIERLNVISLVDPVGETIDSRYLSSDKSTYLPIGKNKKKFVASVLSKLLDKYDVCLASHISLAPAMVPFRYRSRHSVLAAFAHGLEVWQPLDRLSHVCANQLDTIFAVSNFTRCRMIEDNGFHPDKVQVIYNCLDPFIKNNRTTNQSGNLNLQHPNLLTVSRLSLNDGYKGHAQVIQALAKVFQTIPNIHYYIVGEGELITSLRKLAEEQRLSSQVHFLGAVSDAELDLIYEQSDLFVMPSTGEGFGLVFAEVMNYGKAAIAGNLDASGEVVRNGETGLLVDPSSIDDIAQSIT
ncbi:MAG TPA: glycosyltransferase family 4 protein, partial [Blastocatellia bacterium]|nr:glycosyltransferase family 4 protein [Blastocatellia bacterium]